MSYSIERCYARSALVAGPNAQAIAKLGKVLRVLGYAQIWSAKDGLQALKYSAMTPFDVAVVDFNPAAGLGVAFLNRLRSPKAAVGRVVIFGREFDARVWADFGKIADAVLDEPFSAESLAETLACAPMQRRGRSAFDHPLQMIEID